jgi:hypothetical protein
MMLMMGECHNAGQEYSDTPLPLQVVCKQLPLIWHLWSVCMQFLHVHAAFWVNQLQPKWESFQKVSHILNEHLGKVEDVSKVDDTHVE